MLPASQDLSKYPSFHKFPQSSPSSAAQYELLLSPSPAASSIPSLLSSWRQLQQLEFGLQFLLSLHVVASPIFPFLASSLPDHSSHHYSRELCVVPLQWCQQTGSSTLQHGEPCLEINVLHSEQHHC
ncbi:hypothetical protein AQUCO_02700089v1 [Aquilegia coerulea]|uniref:Uncharacterized protein n=1 Tax=Aquilegia coerulea TaxID=218851 RepID=A0A2G5D5Z2_AQUCA|nr:hypothetical protein AQUCO_02700089v1 [Aquilegia coerulea]